MFEYNGFRSLESGTFIARPKRMLKNILEFEKNKDRFDDSVATRLKDNVVPFVGFLACLFRLDCQLGTLKEASSGLKIK